MSLISAKYFPESGWVLIKNSDSILKPSFKIRKSFRKQTERLYIWNNLTKFSEGINEHGVAVISAISNDDILNAKKALVVPEDAEIRTRRFYSPDGLRIRKSLFEKNSHKAINSLIEQQIPGSVIVADEKNCFVLESGFTDKKYYYNVKQLEYNDTVLLGIEDENLEERKNLVSKYIQFSKNKMEFLESMSIRSDENPNCSAIILVSSKNCKRTTGQVVLSTLDRTMYYRPIWCEYTFNLESLNKGNEKTFFEIMSKRKILSFKENFGE